MSEITEIHVVPNTHWDREFRESFEKTRDHLVEMMDRTIDIMLKDPSYKYYVLDAHCLLLDDYLDMRPEMTETVTKLLQERRLLIGPWYTLPDTPNVGAEALARNFLWARKFAQRFGVEVMKSGYTPCNWGQPSQLPQIFSQLGIDSALFYRGISPHECDAEFIWEAPDGSEIIGHRFALFARYNWYYFVFRPVTYGIDPYDKKYRLGNFGEATFRHANCEDGVQNLGNFAVLNPDGQAYREDQLMPALERLLGMEASHFLAPYFLAMHGHDVSVAHPMDTRVIDDINKKQDRFKVVISTPELYMAKVREHLKGRTDVKRLYGERRMNLKEGFWTYLLPATISARTYLKMTNARTERMLVSEAEPLATMAMLAGRPYPARALEKAWRFLLDCHTHDAIAGCAPDDVCADIEFRLRQSRDLSEVVSMRSMQHLAKNLNLAHRAPDAANVVLFNPLPFARNEAVRFEVCFPADQKPQGLRLTDAEGREIEYQSLGVKADGFFIDSVWDVPKNTDVVKCTVIAQVNDIPACGYTTLYAEPLKKPSRTYGSMSASPNVLENNFVRLEVRPNGSATIYSKETGKTYGPLNYFLDEGVAGNAWKHDSPANHTRHNTLGAQAQLALVRDGALEATIEARLSLRIPVDLENREAPDGRYTEIPITTTYTLRRDDPLVYVKTDVDNTARDHWMRAIFTSGVETDLVKAETHFDLTERRVPLPDCHDWVEDVSGTAFMQSMVSLSDGKDGFTLMSEGLLEYEVFDKPGRPVALTLLRAMWIKLEVSEEKKQVLPDQGMQCPGPHTFHYALYPHRGDCLSAQALRHAARRRVPVHVAQVGRTDGALPLRQSLLDASASDVVVMSIKKAEDSNRLIVRGYNPKETEGRLVVKTAFPVKSAVSLAIDERGETPVAHLPNGLDLPIAKKRIFTIGIEPA